MCFSAVASFSSATILGTVGVASLKLSKSSSTIPVASIPILFAVQQFCEGFIWIGLRNAEYEYLIPIFAKAFLFFAMFIWPLWVPFSYGFAEAHPIRKKIINALLVIGSISASFFGYFLLTTKADVSIEGYHIHYEIPFGKLTLLIAASYALATMLPPFLSSLKHSTFTGSALLVSFVVTKIFYGQNVISVWCYFGALTSITLYLVLRNHYRSDPDQIASSALNSKN